KSAQGRKRVRRSWRESRSGRRSVRLAAAGKLGRRPVRLGGRKSGRADAGGDRNWAGLDSNQRRRKASRFTVCPVWPLRYLPFKSTLLYKAHRQLASSTPTIRKIRRSTLPHTVALLGKSPGKSGSPLSVARRARFAGNRHSCSRDRQSIPARANRAGNR